MGKKVLKLIFEIRIVMSRKCVFGNLPSSELGFETALYGITSYCMIIVFLLYEIYVIYDQSLRAYTTS